MKSSNVYKIILLPAAEKFYKKLYFSYQSRFQRVVRSLEVLKTNPFLGKSLRHKLKGKYSLRVGVYRIIYSVEKQKVAIYIFEIGHRRNVYE